MYFKGVVSVTAAPCGLEEVAGADISVKRKSAECNGTAANKDGNCVVDKNESYGANMSVEDIDFSQDSSDYQWFTDYNYRDGNSNMRSSIMSTLSASYMYNDLDCYNDIARDIDVNLAQVDMEDFRTEDIHSLLHTLPQIDAQNEQQGEMYASVSGSLMVKYDFDSSLSHHSVSQEESNGSSGSFYKSEILFSPVREVPLASFSTDSLDCDEHILLTCQANKENYTIAFEGSTVMEGSIDMDSHRNGEFLFSGSTSQEGKSTESSGKTSLNIPSSESSNNCFGGIVDKTLYRGISLQSSDGEIARSSSPYTTWSKLKENSSESIKKHSSNSSGSGSENAIAASSSTSSNINSLPVNTSCAYLKSQSLPNLNPMKNYLLRHKILTGSNPRNKNIFETNTNHLADSSHVKIYSLSNSDYRKQRYTHNEGTSMNLIDRFISQKYTKNFYDKMNNSYNFNYSSNNNHMNVANYGPDQSLNVAGCGDKFRSNTARLNGNLLFEDSLVENKTDQSREFTNNNNGNNDNDAMYDSCSSFSSHTGRLVDVTDKKINNNNIIGNNNNNNAFNGKVMTEKRKCLASEKYSASEPCPVHIMDRSMQTSLSLDCENFQRSCPQHQNNSVEHQANTDKPVYVMYPNYTLPDLSFLRGDSNELDAKNIFLWPQKFSPSPTTEHGTSFADKMSSKKELKKRPCSCPDLDSLKKRNYSHIRDWKSLMFLLPKEYCHLLMQIPELEERFKGTAHELGRSSLCTSGLQSDKSDELSESFGSAEPKVTCVSSSSTATQPSSGYRGSSTMLLTDSTAGTVLPCSPSYVYHNENRTNCRTSAENDGTNPARTSPKLMVTNERPPLPRGILRNPAVQNVKEKQQKSNVKRYSMFELRDEKQPPVEKRRSLPSQLAPDGSARSKTKREDCYSEDEGVETASSHCESPGPQFDPDARRLERLLEGSVSWSEDDMAQLRDQVGQCLSQASRKTVSFANLGYTPPNSPNSSVIGNYKPYQIKLQPAFDLPIREECESSRHSYCDHISSEQLLWTTSSNYKKDLIDSVVQATNYLQSCFNSEYEDDIPQAALKGLCPALYAILNHGLKPTLETAFGDINNSVWQVVEASSQQGPMTRALHELVLKLNSEDVLTEGLVKFNAFIFGLLNVRGLDTWFSYLRTRESILRKHYLDHGLLLSSSRGISSDRLLIDQLLSILKPLTEYNFKLDLLYECRQLHTSLMQLGRNSPSNIVQHNGNNRTSWMLKKIVRSLQNVTGQQSLDEDNSVDKNEPVRPRSCVDSSSGFTFNDIASTVKKRWSGIQFGSKLASAFERLGIEDDEDYSDSLENTIRQKGPNMAPSVMTDKNVEDEEACSAITDTDSEDALTEIDHAYANSQGGKFKQLQRRWERLADQRTSKEDATASNEMSPLKLSDASFTVSKSRIPRPVTSPVRPPSLQFTVATAYNSSTISSAKRHSPLSPTTTNIPMPVSRKSVAAFPSPSVAAPTNNASKSTSSTAASVKSKPTCGLPTRTSRIDQNSGNSSSHVPRPASLPYRSPQKYTATTTEGKSNVPKKRPASASSNRRGITSQRYVRTLSHRLPSDNGHLSFNEGEKLRVILDVDDKWILCCRGDQKGLVPRSAVLPISGHY